MLKCVQGDAENVVNRQNGFRFWFWPGEVECRCHLNIYTRRIHDEKKIILSIGMYMHTSEFELFTNSEPIYVCVC